MPLRLGWPSGRGLAPESVPVPADPRSRFAGGGTQLEYLRIITMELFAQLVRQSSDLLLQVVIEPRQFANSNGQRIVNADPAKAGLVGPQGVGNMKASRPSSLAPAAEWRSRNRSNCLGLTEKTVNPLSIRLSTMAPRGISMAAATDSRSPSQIASNQPSNCAIPISLCSILLCFNSLPSLSARHT